MFVVVCSCFYMFFLDRQYCTLYVCFSFLPKILVKIPAKNLIKNLAKNLNKNLAENSSDTWTENCTKEQLKKQRKTYLKLKRVSIGKNCRKKTAQRGKHREELQEEKNFTLTLKYSLLY